MTDTMRAIAISRPGDPDVLEMVERPRPEPRTGEVLIEVACAGVNRPDILQRRGLYPPPEGASDLPGLEVSGTIVEVGSGADTGLVGTRVCALVAGGGYAEYCAAPVGQCLEMPDSMGFEEAAAIPETLFTVWSNLFVRGGAKSGDTVLVHGGTSGIGTMAIALCRHLDIEIIVTCGSYAKCVAACVAGTDHAIDYNAGDFVDEVMRLTGDKGVEVVLDMVGGDYVPRNLACLADDGRHVSIAFQRGIKAEIDIAQIMRRRLTLTGSTLRARSAAFKGKLADDIRVSIWEDFRRGRIATVIDSVHSLADAAKAHARMEAGEHIGKIVLSVG